jgi:signal transduction histidine kinase
MLPLAIPSFSIPSGFKSARRAAGAVPAIDHAGRDRLSDQYAIGGRREESRKFKAAAEQLAVANQNLSLAEAAMRRSERLAALGQLSAGLAHELRNPLGTIKGSAEMLANSLTAENEVAREVAGFISTEVDRTNLLVSRFLDFARPMQVRVAPADLTQVLDKAIANLEHSSPRYDVSIYRNYAPEIGPIQLDADLMERVFFQPAAECRTSHAARRDHYGQDASRGDDGGNLGNRPWLGDRSGARREHIQSVFYHQAGGRWPGSGDRFENRGRARR